MPRDQFMFRTFIFHVFGLELGICTVEPRGSDRWQKSVKCEPLLIDLIEHLTVQ